MTTTRMPLAFKANETRDEAKVSAHQVIGHRDYLDAYEDQLSNMDDASRSCRSRHQHKFYAPKLHKFPS